MSQVVRIDSDAVSADQTRFEFQKVPFGTGRFEHIGRVYVHPVEDDSQLVHKRNVQITLGVLDDLTASATLCEARDAPRQSPLMHKPEPRFRASPRPVWKPLSLSS